MLLNSKRAKDKDERAPILRNAGPSKDGNKIKISCFLISRRLRVNHNSKSCLLMKSQRFDDAQANTDNPFIALECSDNYVMCC